MHDRNDVYFRLQCFGSSCARRGGLPAADADHYHSTCANIVLDILFVGGLKMGTAGAGLATVIAQGISFVLILVHVLRSRDVFGICIRHPQIHLKRLQDTGSWNSLRDSDVACRPVLAYCH